MTFLLQMAGESGTGKSTLARAVGRSTGALVIDKDDITGPLIDEDVLQVGAGGPGYAVLFKLAESALEQGFDVILDSPAFWQAVLDRGKDLTARYEADYRLVKCYCPDRNQQELRLQGRSRQTGQPRSRAEVEDSLSRPGVMLVPSAPHLEVDTTQPLDACVRQVLEYLA